MNSTLNERISMGDEYHMQTLQDAIVLPQEVKEKEIERR